MWRISLEIVNYFYLYLKITGAQHLIQLSTLSSASPPAESLFAQGGSSAFSILPSSFSYFYFS